MSSKKWFFIGLGMQIIGGFAAIVGALAEKKSENYVVDTICEEMEERYGLTPKDDEDEDEDDD